MYNSIVEWGTLWVWMLLFLVWDQWITSLSSLTHFHWPISLLIWIFKESLDESWPSSMTHHVRFNLTFSSFQPRSSCQDQCHRQPRSCQRDTSSVRQKSVNERPARVSLGIYFQFHFHYPSSAISMSLLLSNKSYFPRFTFKKKAFNLRNSGLTSLKLKSWVTLFSKWSVLEELASWKYHASALWAALDSIADSVFVKIGWVGQILYQNKRSQ